MCLCGFWIDSQPIGKILSGHLELTKLLMKGTKIFEDGWKPRPEHERFFEGGECFAKLTRIDIGYAEIVMGLKERRIEGYRPIERFDCPGIVGFSEEEVTGVQLNPGRANIVFGCG